MLIADLSKSRVFDGTGSNQMVSTASVRRRRSRRVDSLAMLLGLGTVTLTGRQKRIPATGEAQSEKERRGREIGTLIFKIQRVRDTKKIAPRVKKWRENWLNDDEGTAPENE